MINHDFFQHLPCHLLYNSTWMLGLIYDLIVRGFTAVEAVKKGSAVNDSNITQGLTLTLLFPGNSSCTQTIKAAD